MAPPRRAHVWVFLALALAALVEPARASLDAGASTFEGARARYRRRAITDADVVVPQVSEPKPPNEPSVPDTGPGDTELRFAIKEFDVTGNTLVPPSDVEATLAPFVGEGKRIADVQAARDALQKRYADDGFITVAVTIPQQTISDGIVRFDVTEARLGKVEVENPGVQWFSDESVLSATPHLEPGAVLREQDLNADLSAANRNPDRRVRPVLKAGEAPGTVDLDLEVDDRPPLHGSITWDNNHPPGSPRQRLTSTLSYGNLWGLEHQISVAYTFVPNEQFHDAQIISGTYFMPMPWSSDQTLFGYVAWSSTSSGVVNVSGLAALGNGLNAGLRYQIVLPDLPGAESYSHALTLGIDRKDVQNTLALEGVDPIVTPITYLPFSLAYTGTLARSLTLSTWHLGVTGNVAGTLEGGSSADFFANRPAKGVNGNFVVGTMALDETIRVEALLRGLAAGRWIDVPKPPSRAFQDEWTLHIDARGQVASQPLISTEQFLAGGMDSVRGYLQSEQAGDNAWNIQTELRTPALRGFLGGALSEWVQFVAFYDTATLFVQEPAEGQRASNRMNGYGVGFRAGLFDHVSVEFFEARPRESTTPESVGGDGWKFYFRLSAGF